MPLPLSAQGGGAPGGGLQGVLGPLAQNFQMSQLPALAAQALARAGVTNPTPQQLQQMVNTLLVNPAMSGLPQGRPDLVAEPAASPSPSASASSGAVQRQPLGPPGSSPTGSAGAAPAPPTSPPAFRGGILGEDRPIPPPAAPNIPQLNWTNPSSSPALGGVPPLQWEPPVGAFAPMESLSAPAAPAQMTPVASPNSAPSASGSGSGSASPSPSSAERLGSIGEAVRSRAGGDLIAQLQARFPNASPQTLQLLASDPASAARLLAGRPPAGFESGLQVVPGLPLGDLF